MANQYMPILDDRRLDDELAEARRILNYYRLMFVSGNDNPVRQRLIEATDIVVRDTTSFFERWPSKGVERVHTPGGDVLRMRVEEKT